MGRQAEETVEVVTDIFIVNTVIVFGTIVRSSLCTESRHAVGRIERLFLFD